MKQKYFLLITATLALILGTILAGAYFLPQNDDGYSIAPPHLSAPAQPTEFFTFGDQAGQAIFLNLTSTQPQHGGPQFTLVGSAIAAPAGLYQDTSIARCNAGLGMVSPPPGVSLSVANMASQPTPLETINDWLTSRFDEQYAVMLWSPTSTVSDYQLVSMYDLAAGADCTFLIDEDV